MLTAARALNRRLMKNINSTLKITTAMFFLVALTACNTGAAHLANDSSDVKQTNAVSADGNTREIEISADRVDRKASETKFTSVYTDMKRDCKTLEEPASEEAGEPAGACKGFGDYRIFIGYSAWAATISVENLKNADVRIDLGTDYGNYGAKGEKIEWRMADGKPFAVIVRIGKYKDRADGENPYTDKNRAGSTLVVKGLEGFEQIDFTLDGAAADANQKARNLADKNYSKK